MTATSIRVQRPVEREVVARDLVEDGLRFGLYEFDAAEMRGVERPAPELEELARLHPGSIPNVCSISKPCGSLRRWMTS